MIAHGKILLGEVSAQPESVIEIAVCYKAARTELMRELAEAGLIGPDTEITKGQPE